MDSETGVVWFATEKGICSYQSDVVETYGDLSSDNVYAYPNPVEPEFTEEDVLLQVSIMCLLQLKRGRVVV